MALRSGGEASDPHRLLAVLGVSVSIGPAFIADLVPPAQVSAAMSLFQAAFYLGSVAGMSVLVPAAGARSAAAVTPP